MNDWLEIAKLMLPFLFTAGGLAGAVGAAAGAVGACLSMRFVAERNKQEARKSEYDADRVGTELMGSLLDRVHLLTARVVAQEDDARARMMREAEMALQIKESEEKIAELSVRLEACEAFKSAASAAMHQMSEDTKDVRDVGQEPAAGTK